MNELKDINQRYKQIKEKLKLSSSIKRKTASKYLIDLKDLEQSTSPKTFPGDAISLHQTSARADISSAQRDKFRLAADISKTRAKLLESQLIKSSNLKEFKSSNISNLFSSSSLTSEQHAFYSGIYATHLAINLGNSYLGAAKHHGLASKLSIDMGTCLLTELDIEDAKFNYTKAYQVFSKFGFIQVGLQVLLEVANFLFYTDKLSYKMEAIELLKDGKNQIEHIAVSFVSIQSNSSVSPSELQVMIYLVGSELLAYQIDLAFDCDLFAPATLTDFARDCKFETAESAITTAIWLCTHLDRLTYPSEYKECYTQQTLLLLLYRPHKKDSAYQKLLDGYLNQDDLLIS